MGEPKPDDVSDRSWRSLARELENPATIRKAEICSRANASRLNFGRTGPSGEVGVRERLRKKLRRSPEPEEVNLEMARDKGYGGRSQRKKPIDSIMHGSRDEGLQLEDEDLPQKSRQRQEESPEYFTSPRGTREGRQHRQDGSIPDVEITANTTVSSGVLSISNEDLARHPMVMRMMQRLEALEGKRTQGPVDTEPVRADRNSQAAAEEISEQLPNEDSLVEEAIVAENSEAKQVRIVRSGTELVCMW